MSMPNKFHLAFICNFTPDEWTGPFGSGGAPWDGQFYIDTARALERAGFDYIILEDKLMVPEAYGGTADAALVHAMEVPKHDPVPLAVALGLNTKHLGIVTTLSTMAYPPFMVARLASTVDSMLNGRFGWNIVTSAEDLAAQNFGMEALPTREERYARADEYVEVVKALFDSWDHDAVVLDRETGTYADPSKVRPIHHRGKYYSVRGPLNTVPSPQHRPAFVQAGASPRGRAFAAAHADSIIAIANKKEGMKQFRDDVRDKAVQAGRDPDSVKVLFCITPTVANTTEEAFQKRDGIISSPQFITEILAQISAITEIDFKAFDLDSPLPNRLTTNGEQGSLDQLQQWGSGKTLRELVVDSAGGLVSSLDLVGTPDDVASQMEEAMEYAGGDGYIITTPLLRLSRHFVADITEGLVPALQRRGLTRSSYVPGSTLRANLTEF